MNEEVFRTLAILSVYYLIAFILILLFWARIEFFIKKRDSVNKKPSILLFQSWDEIGGQTLFAARCPNPSFFAVSMAMMVLDGDTKAIKDRHAFLHATVYTSAALDKLLMIKYNMTTEKSSETCRQLPTVVQ